MARLGMAAVLAVAFLATRTAAQDERAAPWVILRAEAPPDSPFVADVAARLEAGGATVSTGAAREQEDGERVAIDRLRRLAGVERALVAARAEAARLDEGEALTRLARARADVSELGDVPGVTRFAAEVELLLGLVAAQAGRRALATQALRAAMTLDTSREIGAAEAPPDVVALADRLRREVATGPRGRFAVRAAAAGAATTDLAGARVFVDDRLVGAAPIEVEAPVGRHVVRIEAPGHRPFAKLVDVFEGERAPWRIVLAPTSDHARRSRLDAAIDGGDLGTVVAALDAFADEARVVFLFASDARAFAVECTREGCRGPARVRENGSFAATREAEDGALRVAREEASRTPPIARESPPRRRRVRRGVPPVLAATAAASVAAVAVAVRGAGAPRTLRLQIDGSALASTASPVP